ncbi:NUC153 and WD40 repeat-containing nucleolar rRNA processing-related protein [Pholiota molesta]|nr:NUC153 and WD40 repeat-containing nucleolar rRNA processing-related protein [Pholiota molesta]
MVADATNVRVYTVNGAAAGSSSSLPDGYPQARRYWEGKEETIQGFEFPEASNRVKTTRDGHHVIATGTYKPQMRVWDLDQLSLKFERHSDAENVDFVILSDDWTKSVHLQNDRTIELHTQGGFHYRTRIPRFGRSLAKRDYRLNLDQGRFLNPLVLEDGDDGEILGVNVIDINPVHHLLAFGVDGNGTTQFWDPRSRTCVGTLRLPRERLMSVSAFTENLSVTAIASRADGLSYAIGTSTGHTLLYDIHQGYGGSRMAGDGVKIWDRNDPASNFASITPATDLNDVHHVPGSGLIMSANEGSKYQTTRSVYEDYKFVERSELKTLGLDHLIGTPALKPYMHGYFLSLKLYDTARIIANPFAYEEHREKMVREKLEKEAETRIRAKKVPGVKVNKALAEKILRDEEKAKLHAEKKSRHKHAAIDGMDDPAFAIDENSREYALLNPSSVAQNTVRRGKTAVEEEEEESDKLSSDGLGSDDESEGEASDVSSDSSAEGELTSFDPRSKPGQRNYRAEEAYARQKAENRKSWTSKKLNMAATFGQRRTPVSTTSTKKSGVRKSRADEEGPMEISWVPSSSSARDDEDGDGKKSGRAGKDKTRRKGIESFGAERKGRTQRRQGIRSGSKNVFRRIDG